MQEAPVNFNPYLKPWLAPQPNNMAGKGVIEQPGQCENMVWQTRKAEPTQYENDFGDALEKVFEAGAVELEEVAAGLNRVGFRTPEGAAWNAERLAAEFRLLAE
ncbi:MAG TPA: recombinase-like helix-turn-helix domain-containing protein [Paraburkholderia sp.]|uniref:recombinase-like helix-turn-helix domain-containing protein n=1 Tax=Paraburkholderia sp. TaxID=1926495 RepID=UPI002C8B95BC|nr:recombinase-like helix-turn-helix domain-containing protein [Paraburkholderia sp.]HTR09633.1 recombinase-like helix-turn-helix domain-containing protein [Paraburkholderia sp.]